MLLVVGGLWGVFSGGGTSQVVRIAVDFATFMGLYAGVYCGTTRTHGRPDSLAAACAGASSGAFLAARSGSPPRTVFTTAVAVSIASVFIDGYSGGDVVNSMAPA